MKTILTKFDINAANLAILGSKPIEDTNAHSNSMEFFGAVLSECLRCGLPAMVHPQEPFLSIDLWRTLTNQFFETGLFTMVYFLRFQKTQMIQKKDEVGY